MTERRARNEISRTRELSARAAELLDDGAGDAEAAATLSDEFGRKITARTVGSFRKRDWAPVANARLARIEAASRTQMILDAARGAGATYAEAATDILSKLMYDMMLDVESGKADPENILAIGKSLAKIREIDMEAAKLAVIRDREAAARAIKTVVESRKLDPAELVKKVDEIMGIKKS